MFRIIVTTLLTEFDTTTLTFEEVSIKNKTYILPKLPNGQQVPVLETPWIEMNCYGIPKLNEHFRTDSDRMFIKIPLEPDTPMFKSLTLIDNLMQSDDMTKKLFKTEGYTYTPIIKLSQNTEYPPCMKVKLMRDPGNVMETEFFEANSKLTINKLQDACEAMPYKSNLKILIKISKVWVINKSYGITLKAIKVKVKPSKMPKTSYEFTEE